MSKNKNSKKLTNSNDISAKFGMPAKEDVYAKYIDRYYIVKPIGANEHYVGKIKEIDVKKGKITLNPYFGLSFNRKSGKNLYNLIDRDYDVFLEFNKISFEPTTEESILYNCYLSNKDRINKKQKSKKKRAKKSLKNAN